MYMRLCKLIMFHLFCLFIYSTVVCMSPLWDVAHILMLGYCAFAAAVQSTARAVLDCLNSGFVGLNLTWSKKEFVFSEVSSCFKRARGLNL